jgi:hypothetical protein
LRYRKLRKPDGNHYNKELKSISVTMEETERMTEIDLMPLLLLA